MCRIPLKITGIVSRTGIVTDSSIRMLAPILQGIEGHRCCRSTGSGVKTDSPGAFQPLKVMRTGIGI